MSAPKVFAPSPSWRAGDWITYVSTGSKQFKPKDEFTRVWRAKKAPEFGPETGSGFHLALEDGLFVDSGHFRLATRGEVRREMNRLAKLSRKFDEKIAELNDVYQTMKHRGYR